MEKRLLNVMTSRLDKTKERLQTFSAVIETMYEQVLSLHPPASPQGRGQTKVGFLRDWSLITRRGGYKMGGGGM